MKKLFAALLVLCLVVSGTMVFEKQYAKASCNEGFYKISTDDPIWETFETVDEMREAVYLDVSVFTDLSTQEVLRAVLEYPLISDVFAYEDNSIGIRRVSAYCTALRVLLHRKDVKSVIRDAYSNIAEVKAHICAPIVNVDIAEMVIERILDYYGMRMSINSADIQSTVETPNGTRVLVYIRTELSKEDREKINEDVQKAYPRATLISGSSRKYNCHSYAWYSQSIMNGYWMNDPTAYMTDGSYTKVTQINMANVIYYYTSGLEHSAVLVETSGPNVSAAIVKSKWGQGPLMQHSVRYCPYAASKISYWKRNK